MTPRYELTAPAERDLEDIFFEVKEHHGQLVAERVTEISCAPSTFSRACRRWVATVPSCGRRPIASGPRDPRSSPTERMSDASASYGLREPRATGAVSRRANHRRIAAGKHQSGWRLAAKPRPESDPRDAADGESWRAGRDSNPRPSGSKPDALSS